MHHLIDALMVFAQGHPHWIAAVVLLVAWAESLAIVGTFVPAAVVMFTAGALVGHEAVSLWPVLISASLGAVAGDALSYELGRGRESQLRGTGLFQRHQSAVRKAEDFLVQHGTASVVLARFTGPVRAFVPLLAGFARMPRWRFYTVNVLSAGLWAPAHILPGVVFGASLQLAEAVTGRLALLLAIVVVVLWGAVWLVTRALAWLIPIVGRARQGLVRFARRRSGPIARLALDVLDPERPGSHALLTGAALLLGCTWAFFGIVEDVLSRDPLVLADQSIFAFLQGVRVGAIDRVMVGITELGSIGVMLPLIVVVFAWLVWHGCWRTARYWLATVFFAELLVQVLKFTLGRHRPLALYAGNEAFSFPSGHATVSTVVLGFLAFLLVRGQSRPWRLTVVTVTTGYVALVALSRLYLGAHWFSDVAGGISVGLAWVALVAMVYTHRDIRENLWPGPLVGLCIATIVVSGAAWMALRGESDRAMYVAAVPEPEAMTQAQWQSGGWRSLPRQREELAGDVEERLLLQWACSEQGVQAALIEAQWHAAPARSVANTLRALAPGTSMTELPVLPRWDAGRRSRIEMIRRIGHETGARMVIRLWHSGVEIVLPDGSMLPLWYGTVYREQRRAGTSVLFEQQPLDEESIKSLLPHAALAPSSAGADGPLMLSCASTS